MANRTLDLLRIAAAARAVGSRHIAIRRAQLDVYSRTSTVGKAARAEAGKLYDAIRAAEALADRLKDDVPEWASSTAEAAAARAAGATTSSSPRADPVYTQDAVKTATATQESIPHSVAGGVGDSISAGPNDDVNDERVQEIQESRGEGMHITEETAEETARDLNADVFYDKSSQLRTENAASNTSQTDARAEVDSQDIDIMKALGSASESNTSEAISGTQLEDSKNTANVPEEVAPYQMSSSAVPSGRISRFLHYGQLASSLAFGAVGESFRRVTGSSTSAASSILLGPANLERLVKKLSRMRGAALKLGQMISFQDSKMLPPAIQEVLQRVQDSADFMPPAQRDKVLRANLGDNWRDLFSDFGETPIAAASIGQVHSGKLASTGEDVAIKIQYPGVATSIDSDLNNLSILLTASRLLPKGMFLDKTIANARIELGWECDYVREADACKRFRQLLEGDTAFRVPRIIDEASGTQVLTMEYMPGKAVTKLPDLTQEQRDWIGSELLRLCFLEMAQWRFMQSDPNWTNYLFSVDPTGDPKASSSWRISLLDFGASREYPEEFIVPYLNLLKAASIDDSAAVESLSRELGYLATDDSRLMVKTHVQSILTLATPFSRNAPELFDFGEQGVEITEKVRSFIPVMLRERTRSPPEETYSLHRKLSGAFLLLARLKSRVRVRDLFSKGLASR